VSGTELQALAALRGVNERVASVARAREALNAQAKGRGVVGGLGGQAWRRMAPELRQVLLSLATDRPNVEAAAAMPWEQMSEVERLSIGVLAREWKRQIDGAGWLR
jgi:hypothetical protein